MTQVHDWITISTLLRFHGFNNFLPSFSWELLPPISATSLPPILPVPGRPAALSPQVIRIQSDLPILWVPRRVAAMERSKAIFSIQVCRRASGPPLQWLLWLLFEAIGSLVVGSLFLFFSLDEVLLFFRLPPSTPLLAGCWSNTFLVSLIMWSGWASLHSEKVLLRGF